jgi:hypothetical protein
VANLKTDLHTLFNNVMTSLTKALNFSEAATVVTSGDIGPQGSSKPAGGSGGHYPASVGALG